MPLCYQRLCQSCCAVANAADVCQCYTLLVLLSVFVSAVCCCQAWCWCCHVVLSKAEADSGVLQVWNPGNYCFNVMHLAILLPAAVPSLPLPLSFCPVLSLPLPCPPLPCPALPCPALPCLQAMAQKFSPAWPAVAFCRIAWNRPVLHDWHPANNFCVAL